MEDNNKTEIKVLFLICMIIIFCALIFFINRDKKREENVFNQYNAIVSEINNTTNIIEKETKSDDNGFAVRVGYLLDLAESNERKFIFDNYEDFKEFFTKNNNTIFDGEGNPLESNNDGIFTKYDEEYFNNNNLAVEYIVLSSGSITITYKGININNEEVEILYDRDEPEIGTMDMSGYFVIAEVPKEITKIK